MNQAPCCSHAPSGVWPPQATAQRSQHNTQVTAAQRQRPAGAHRQVVAAAAPSGSQAAATPCWSRVLPPLQTQATAPLLQPGPVPAAPPEVPAYLSRSGAALAPCCLSALLPAARFLEAVSALCWPRAPPARRPLLEISGPCPPLSPAGGGPLLPPAAPCQGSVSSVAPFLLAAAPRCQQQAQTRCALCSARASAAPSQLRTPDASCLPEMSATPPWLPVEAASWS
mmetsp:Transcript_1599/g.3865  ORF Transcript_1599/g.3865 Transcript_1599/m.3865 type:complete len:226 (+) Transcript_1599:285-962(+)